MITLKNQILNILNEHENIAPKSIDTIMYYYGFTGEIGSTLESTGQNFGVTRERVRQLLNIWLRRTPEFLALKPLKAAAQILNSRDIWLMSEFKTAVEKSIGNIDTHPLNLLALIHDMDKCKDYSTYDSLALRIHKPEEDNFIIKKDKVEAFRDTMKAVRTVPGIVGIVDSSELNIDENIPFSIIDTAIKINPNSWTYEDDGKLFYLYEDRDNFLINSSEKVFTISDEVNIDRLSESLTNALRRRSSKYTYPSSELVKRYIQDSIYFNVKNNLVTFKGKKVEFSDIDTLLISELKKHTKTNYITLSNVLVAAGFNKPNIDKAIMTSPFVYVDKSKGPRFFTYSLV